MDIISAGEAVELATSNETVFFISSSFREKVAKEIKDKAKKGKFFAQIGLSPEFGNSCPGPGTPARDALNEFCRDLQNKGYKATFSSLWLNIYWERAQSAVDYYKGGR